MRLWSSRANTESGFSLPVWMTRYNIQLPKIAYQNALVAQLDRVTASEAVGQWFESTRVHHQKNSHPKGVAIFLLLPSRVFEPPSYG